GAALERRERRGRRRLPVGLHAGAGPDPARSYLRDDARALRLPRRLDAGRRRAPCDQRSRNAGVVEYLPGQCAALDQPPRWPVAPHDLHARPLAERHRGELRPADPGGATLRAALLGASGALRTRKRRQRPPLTPSPRKRGRRMRRRATPIIRWLPPSPRLARSRDNLARSRFARAAHGARQSRARQDAWRRTRLRAAIVKTAVPRRAD